MNALQVLILITALLLFETLGHRFQRHEVNENGLVDEIESNAVDSIKNVNQLTFSNEADSEAEGNDIKLIGNGDIELILRNEQLQFYFCSDNCMNISYVFVYSSIFLFYNCLE